MSTIEQMKKFVEPRSVAIFGVSRRTGEGTYNILEHLLSYGYQGKVYPINPNATEILGIKAYPQVADIEGEIDLAVISLPRVLVPDILRQCAARGIQSVIVITQGFADAIDEDGKRLQNEINEIVRQNGIRVLGPNSLGTANPFLNFSSSFVKLKMARIPVGVICQTGSFFGFELGLLGKGIDLGNACDISFIDALEYFEQDSEAKAIALHIEGIQDGRKFMEVVRRIARKKPVIALKTGRSESAARAIQSHTGSLAGSDEVWEAAFKQAGVIRVGSMEELIELATAFASLPLMKGNRIGVISISGGLGVIVVDVCHQSGLEIARLSPVTTARIGALVPSWQSVGNPIDLWSGYMVAKQPFTKLFTEATDALLSDGGVDAFLLIWSVRSPQHGVQLQHILSQMAEVHADKPVVCCLAGAYAEETRNKLEATGRIKVFSIPDRAVRVLGHLARYSASRMTA